MKTTIHCIFGMKPKTNLLGYLIFALIFSTITASAQTPEYRIANWYNDKKAAFSVGFDDNSGFNYEPKVLADRGLKATYWIMTNLIHNDLGWDTVRSVVKMGHAVGSHSIDRSGMSGKNNNGIQKAVMSKKTIEDSILNYKCYVVAYPGGGKPSPLDSLATIGYISGRVAGPKSNKGNGIWRSTTFDFGAMSQDGASASKIENDLKTVYTHGLWYDGFWHGTSSEADFIKIADMLQSKTDSFWHDSFENISKYWIERFRKPALKKISEDANTLVMNLEDTVTAQYDTVKLVGKLPNDGDILNHPLTIIMKKPVGVTIQSASQNGKLVPLVDKGDAWMFNVIPDGGNIVFQKSGGGVQPVINQLNFKDAALTYKEDVGMMKFRMTLSSSSSDTSFFHVALDSGNAQRLKGYSDSLFYILPNTTTSKEFGIPIMDDAQVNQDSIFVFGLKASSKNNKTVVIGNQKKLQVKLVDNDTIPHTKVSFAMTSTTIDESKDSIDIQIICSNKPMDSIVTVELYMKSGNTQRFSSTFPLKATIGVNMNSTLVKLALKNDKTFQQDESVELGIRKPMGGIDPYIGNERLNIKITDNDDKGSLASIFSDGTSPSDIFFPNPFYSNIKTKIAAQSYGWRVYDLGGRLVLSAITPIAEISLSTLKDGVYIIELQTEWGVYKQRAIKR